MKAYVLALSLCLFHFAQPAFAQDPPQYGTPFAGVPDPRDASLYQVNIRPFSPAGDLKGVEARLDRIAALGVNVLYLLPHTPVGILKSLNSPYCPREHKQVAEEFGTLEDLRRLVAGAHDRGMAVLLDWVANHTAWDHPWIEAHPEWYVRDGSGVIQPARIGGFTWTDVAQLDFRNHDMRKAMIEALRYWLLAVNADGYRFDFVDGVPIDFWAEATASLRSLPGRKVILYAEGGRFDNFKHFDYNHGFSFYDGLKQMYSDRQETALKVEGENDYHYQGSTDMNRIVRYTSNHDVNDWDGPPQGFLGGQRAAMSAFVLAAYNRGVPLIYNGQEIALDYGIKFPFTMEKIQWTENPEVTDEYARLIKLRAASTALRRGMPQSYSSRDISAFVKTSGSEKVLVLVNVRNRPVSFQVPGALANTTWHHAFEKTSRTFGAAGSQVELQPFQYLVYLNTPLPTGMRGGIMGARDEGFGARMEAGTLRLTGLASGSRVTVRDAAGRVRYRSMPGSEVGNLGVAALERGVYSVSVQGPGGGRAPARRIVAVP